MAEQLAELNKGVKSGDKYRSIATANGGQTFGSQYTYLWNYYNALSEDEKKRAVLIEHYNASTTGRFILHINNIDKGCFTRVDSGGSSNIAIYAVNLKTANGIYCIIPSNSITGYTDISNTSANISLELGVID